jgi:hypothetical protein
VSLFLTEAEGYPMERLSVSLWRAPDAQAKKDWRQALHLLGLDEEKSFITIITSVNAVNSLPLPFIIS